MKTTITEALAEIKTIGKRLEAKEKYVLSILTRDSKLIDPIEGGSSPAVKQAIQSYDDLQKRIVVLRGKIAEANAVTFLEIDGVKRSVADWITWKREVAPVSKEFVSKIANSIERARRISGNDLFGSSPDKAPNQIIVNLDESLLAKRIENLEKTLGELDGKLSLINATTTIEVPD